MPRPCSSWGSCPPRSAPPLSPAISPAAPASAAEARRPALPDRIELPDNFQPEGITTRGGPWAYLGSRRDGGTGHLVRTLTSSGFEVPTTVASYGASLYLPNARFNTPPTPTTDYWITRIHR